MELKPKSRREVEGIVQDAISSAVDFVESEISQDRIKAQRYYDGEVDLGYEDGRSKVVATKVRDTVRAVKPSLMRIFLSTAKPVDFVPRGPEDVAMAEQATEFMHHEFTRLNGYRVINDAFQDALVKKQGIVKAYWMTYPEAEIYTFTDLSDDEFLDYMTSGFLGNSLLGYLPSKGTQLTMKDGFMPPAGKPKKTTKKVKEVEKV